MRGCLVHGRYMSVNEQTHTRELESAGLFEVGELLWRIHHGWVSVGAQTGCLTQAVFSPVSPGRVVTAWSERLEALPHAPGAVSRGRESKWLSRFQGTSKKCKRIEEPPMDGRALV